MTCPSDTHISESDFHDQWADATALENVQVQAYWSAPTAMENQYLLGQLPADLSGWKILDIGAGLGESSIMFAKRNADVTAMDISPAMADFAANLARFHGVQICTVTCAAEIIPFSEPEWDLIHVANTIHHLEDKTAFLQKVRAILKPGGIFISWDPVKYNPVIAVYRKLAHQLRTVSEAPLGVSDLRLLRKYFPDLQTRHFWLLTQALFLKYAFIDRVHPNSERYWKRIYRETNSSLWWWLPLRAIDQILLRLPVLRWFSWNIVVIARNESKSQKKKP